MEQLITRIHNLLEDYRADENQMHVRMTPQRIKRWIDQFDDNARVPILTELSNIFQKRYCSKEKVKTLLDEILTVLAKDFKFSTMNEFLKNSTFLDLQPSGKSQKIMLHLLNDLLQSKYGIHLSQCGTASKKYSIYVDDILCTGLTLISDLKDWSELNFLAGKTNKDAVADNSTILIFAYIFVHIKNYHKKVAEMKHKISSDVANKHKMYANIKIENEADATSKIDLLLPVESGQPQQVVDYKNQIAIDVDAHTKGKYDRISPEEFFRPAGLPKTESFFTSAINRDIVEKAFLKKGIEILSHANVANRNMRALGYSIPSLKNFGFGALCFTWRNVPNNAPLVFWYHGGGFTPLFSVQRGLHLPHFVHDPLPFYYSQLSEDWKDVIKLNIFGLNDELSQKKVFDKHYIPSTEELRKINILESLDINMWENEPPRDDYGVDDLAPLNHFPNLKNVFRRSLNITDEQVQDFAERNPNIEIWLDDKVFNEKNDLSNNDLPF